MKKLIALIVAPFVLIAAARSEEPIPGKQVEQKLAIGEKTVKYLLYLPNDFKGGAGQWPFMLFLHGRGESSGPLSLVKKWGPPRLLDHGESFPYIIASPQCPAKESWAQPGQQELLLKLIEHIEKTYSVDQNRVYLTGLSMGGYGTWQMATRYPDLFAAIVPICGGGDPNRVQRIAKIPTWVFHGEDDRTVPIKRSEEMVEAMKAAGATDIQFTRYPSTGHDSWTKAYNDPKLYEWLLSHKRSDRPAAAARQ